MTRSSSKELITPFENLKRVFRSKRRLFETPGLVESSSPELDLFSDIENIRGRNGSEHEDVNKHIKKVLDIIDLFHIPELTQDQDCPLKEEGNTLGAPYQPGGQYRAAGPGFYQHNNGNSSYPDRRQKLEELLTKFIAESTKRHKENSNIIKEIQASIDAAIRNQGASTKTLEIQIGQMSKVLQERGIGGQPSSIEPNLKDHVKLISIAKADSSEIHHMGCSSYVVLGSQHRSIFTKTVPFIRRLQNYYCDDWRKAQDVKILEAYDHTLP
nr:hypothetical protein [Tanacetum cinerariifolium]